MNEWMFQVPGNQLKKINLQSSWFRGGRCFHRAKKRSENTTPGRSVVCCERNLDSGRFSACRTVGSAGCDSAIIFATRFVFSCSGDASQGLWMKGFFPLKFRSYKTLQENTEVFLEVQQLDAFVKGSLEMLDFFWLAGKYHRYVAIKYTIPPKKKDAMWYETCRCSITRRHQAEGNPSVVGIFRPTRRGASASNEKGRVQSHYDKKF